MRLPLVMLLFSLMLVACSPSETAIQTAIAETAIAQPIPTETPRPPTATARPSSTATLTPVPTDTPPPTSTGTSTTTPTRTPTSTVTPTATPDLPALDLKIPGSLFLGPATTFGSAGFVSPSSTGWLVSVSEDGMWYEVRMANGLRGWLPAERLEDAGEGVAELLPVSTSVPTPTPTSTPAPPTATPDIRDQFVSMDIRELDSYADNYLGEKVRLYGQVFNIQSGALQMWVSNVAVVVVIPASVEIPPGIYEDTWITVYGTVAGYFTGTNTFGGTIQQPLIRAVIIEK